MATLEHQRPGIKRLIPEYFAVLPGFALLSDFLEEGLSMLGRSCEEFEIGRL